MTTSTENETAEVVVDLALRARQKRYADLKTKSLHLVRRLDAITMDLICEGSSELREGFMGKGDATPEHRLGAILREIRGTLEKPSGDAGTTTKKES